MGGGGALILERCQAFDLFASVDAHLWPDPQLPEINGAIADLFQDQWPLVVRWSREEHLEERRVQDKQKKLPVAHHLLRGAVYSGQAEAACCSLLT